MVEEGNMTYADFLTKEVVNGYNVLFKYERKKIFFYGKIDRDEMRRNDIRTCLKSRSRYSIASSQEVQVSTRMRKNKV
mgnify:CR=1 FL=1